MKRKYECLFIIASNVPEEKRSGLIAKFSKMAGDDTTVEKWGMRKFAAPIKHRKEGFYVLMNFSAASDVVGGMSKLMNITDGIERYIFVVKDERQLAAESQRKNKKVAQAGAKEEKKGEKKDE